MRKLITIVGLLSSVMTYAQTDVSLFMKSDKVQRAEIDTTEADIYKSIGHHGPAIENKYMALRLYFNNSGAIDVYSKAKPGLELKEYGWYPTEAQIAEGAGCDEYRVGKTTGLGGVSLWDGEKEVKLVATEGRKVGVSKDIKGNSQMYMIARGVEYRGKKVDIKVTVTVSNKSRVADITAECVNGHKVMFMTGVNFHKGQSIELSDGRIAVWGIHPADVVKNPLPIGGAIVYNKRKWKGSKIDTEKGFIGIVTPMPVVKAKTRVVAACSREDNLNTEEKFFNFVKNL
ncbi:MAG: DUF4861 family protein [Bacteroidales bacterium]|nr:DUF4861 family protein [Bacteroidales bacterium]